MQLLNTLYTKISVSKFLMPKSLQQTVFRLLKIQLYKQPDVLGVWKKFPAKNNFQLCVQLIVPFFFSARHFCTNLIFLLEFPISSLYNVRESVLIVCACIYFKNCRWENDNSGVIYKSVVDLYILWYIKCKHQLSMGCQVFFGGG